MSRENSLVTAQWVEDNLDNPDIVLIEVDEDTTAYDKGHIKGAIKLDWTTDLQDQVRRDFVDKQQFEALLNAVFGFCLGCEMYLLIRRIAGGRAAKAASA